MKILYLGDSTGIHDFRFITKLVEKGYETHVVSFSQNPTIIKGCFYYSFPYNIKKSSSKINFTFNYLKKKKLFKKQIKKINKKN